MFYLKKYIYMFAIEMASPENQHCAICIGALSFRVDRDIVWRLRELCVICVCTLSPPGEYSGSICLRTAMLPVATVTVWPETFDYVVLFVDPLVSTTEASTTPAFAADETTSVGELALCLAWTCWDFVQFILQFLRFRCVCVMGKLLL